MYVIIVGASKIGATLAEILSKEKCNVVIVDKQKEKLDRLADVLDVQVIHGSGTEVNTLREAGAEKADVIVSATSDDAVNLMVCELAKMLGIHRRITLSHNQAHRAIFEEVGVEEVIYPSSIIATYIRNLILRPGIRSVLTTLQDAEIIEMKIPEGSAVAGRQIKDVGMPEGSTIAAIHRNGELIIHRGKTVLMAGDLLTVLAKKEVIKKVINLIRARE